MAAMLKIVCSYCLCEVIMRTHYSLVYFCSTAETAYGDKKLILRNAVFLHVGSSYMVHGYTSTISLTTVINVGRITHHMVSRFKDKRNVLPVKHLSRVITL